MKKNIKYIVIFIWIIIICILKINNVISLDIDVLKQYFEINTLYVMVIFTLIWILRIIVFIPGITLIILGGACFGTVEAILLSMIGLILSETIVYMLSKTILGPKLKNLINNKYPSLSPLAKEYNYKLLGLGIICPIAPTDAVCFMLASVGMSYGKYIMVVIVSNVPGLLLYSFLGLSFTNSILAVTLTVVSIVMITIFSIKIWNNLKRKVSLSSKMI